jgi:16S rRNA processing protein RimM
MGMRVIDVKSNDLLGVVESLNNYGANDCLELTPTQESIDNQKRLIPFVIDKFISSINREESVIFVNWDKGF